MNRLHGLFLKEVLVTIFTTVSGENPGSTKHSTTIGLQRIATEKLGFLVRCRSTNSYTLNLF